MDVANILNIPLIGTPYYEYIEYSWVSFFMASFFFVSGLCSNMNKTFSTVLIQGLKSLILPTLILSVLSSPFKDAAFDKLEIATPFMLLKRLYGAIICFSGNWFIQAMFIGRIIYWIINRYSKDWRLVIGFSVFLFFIGTILIMLGIDNSTYRVNNSLMAVVFFAFGQYLRERGISVRLQKISWVMFVLLFVSTLIFFQYRPVYVQNVIISYCSIIPLLLLGIFGSVAFLALCKVWGKCKFLEYYGRNSLVVYITHISILFYVESTLKHYINSIMFFILAYIIALMIITVLIQLFNLKYMKLLLGKF